MIPGPLLWSPLLCLVFGVLASPFALWGASIRVGRDREFPTNKPAVEGVLPRVAARLSLVRVEDAGERWIFVQPAKLLDLSLHLEKEASPSAAAGRRDDKVVMEYASKLVTNYLLSVRIDEADGATRVDARCRAVQEREGNAPWLAGLFLSAVAQELEGGPPKAARTEPQKTWPAFLLLDLVNPGLALHYGYGNPLNRQAPGIAAFLGVVDLGFVGLTVAGAIDPKIGTAAIGVIGLVALRHLAGFMFGWDVNSWRRIQKSGYRIDASLWDGAAGVRIEREF